MLTIYYLGSISFLFFQTLHFHKEKLLANRAGDCRFYICGKNVRHIIKLFKAKAIIQTNYFLIFDILYQLFITYIISIIRIDLRLIQVFLFFQKFKLDVRHKPKKQHIISNALNYLTNTNTALINPYYSKLYTLFIYIITLIEIDLIL